MNIKIVFITKSLCYHQVYLSDDLFCIYGDNFHFIQTREPLDFRVKAHQEGFERSYLRGYSRNENERKECIELLRNADVIIVGEASRRITKFFNKKAILLEYSERLFKKELDDYSYFHRIKRRLMLLAKKIFPRCKKRYLLSAGAYTLLDYKKVGLYSEKNAFVWGYFPIHYEYDIDDLLKKKENNSKLTIVWANRLKIFKHPETAIEVANFLRSKNVNFVLHIIGDGDEKAGESKKTIVEMIKNYHLNDNVIVHGKLPSEEVLDYYKECDIALFTTSFCEGWGVGLNEAMNAGCAVVSSHSVGSARYLIKNGVNGFLYEYGNNQSLFDIMYKLVNDKDLRKKLGKKAYETISTVWNCHTASKRLSELINCILNNVPTIYTEGPCSKAKLISEKYENK